MPAGVCSGPDVEIGWRSRLLAYYHRCHAASRSIGTLSRWRHTMADGTPGIGQMVAVVGAASVVGLIAPGGVQAEPPPPSPHVLAAQDLLDHASAPAERAGGNRMGVSLIGISAWVAIPDQSRYRLRQRGGTGCLESGHVEERRCRRPKKDGYATRLCLLRYVN